MVQLSEAFKADLLQTTRKRLADAESLDLNVRAYAGRYDHESRALKKAKPWYTRLKGAPAVTIFLVEQAGTAEENTISIPWVVSPYHLRQLRIHEDNPRISWHQFPAEELSQKLETETGTDYDPTVSYSESMVVRSGDRQPAFLVNYRNTFLKRSFVRAASEAASVIDNADFLVYDPQQDKTLKI